MTLTELASGFRSSPLLGQTEVAEIAGLVGEMDIVIVSLAETIDPSPANFLDNDDERAVLQLIVAAAPD